MYVYVKIQNPAKRDIYVWIYVYDISYRLLNYLYQMDIFKSQLYKLKSKLYIPQSQLFLYHIAIQLIFENILLANTFTFTIQRGSRLKSQLYTLCSLYTPYTLTALYTIYILHSFYSFYFCSINSFYTLFLSL